MVRIWNTSTGVSERLLKGHTDGVLSVAFSVTGSRLVSGSMDTIRVWNASTGQAEHVLEGHSKWASVAFSPDDSSLVLEASICLTHPQPALRYSPNSMWLFAESPNRTCWIPLEHRGGGVGHIFKSISDTRACFTGSPGGSPVVVLDFGAPLCSMLLRNLQGTNASGQSLSRSQSRARKYQTGHNWLVSSSRPIMCRHGPDLPLGVPIWNPIQWTWTD
ncbi:WD40-repeat-containing domain protein [Gautieria morchelliformis]|nr:WD40-repeat-containing domain protein [Gautieria morchelliformis]